MTSSGALRAGDRGGGLSRWLAPGAADNRLLEPLGAVLDRAPAAWNGVLQRWRAGPAGRSLVGYVEARQAAGATVYPAEVFRALEMTPRATVRVVILGQDPYHGAGLADGLAFSVPTGVRPPPSLRNILAELRRDIGVQRQGSGHLGGWAAQGVLLLNAVLTVEQGQAASHAGHGWEALTDDIIRTVAEDTNPRVFMLWGACAQTKAPLIDAVGAGRHLVLRANHPSPLSARRPPVPFLGCGHFGQASRFLASVGRGRSAPDWSA